MHGSMVGAAILLFAAIGCHSPSPILRLERDDQNAALAAAFSADGTYVAAGDVNGTIRVWDTTTGRALAQRGGFSRPANLAAETIVFSPDGNVVAFSTAGGVEVWDWVQEQSKSLAGQAVPPHDMMFRDDGAVVAVSGGHHVVPGKHSATREPIVVIAWDSASARVLSRIEDDTSGGINVKIAPDGRRFAMNCIEGTPRRFDELTPTTPLRARLRVCDVATGRTEAVAELPAGGGAWYMRFSPDGNWLFTSLLMGKRSGALRDAKSAKLTRELEIGIAVFSTDSRTLTSFHAERVGVFHPAMLVMPVAVQRNDWRIVTLDLESHRRQSRRIKLRESDREACEPLAFTSDRKLLVDQALRIWEFPGP